MDHKDTKYHWWVAPSDKKLQQSQQKVQYEFQKWKKNRFFWQAALWFCYLFPWFFLGGIAALVAYYSFKIEYGFLFITGYFLHPQILIVLPAVLSFVIGVWSFVRYARRMQADLVKLAIAQRFQWKYYPTNDNEGWHNAYLQFHEVFRKGNANRYVHDQFWGDVNGVPFWAGDFHYVIRSHYGEYKDDNRFNEHFFAIKIPRPVQGELLLKSEKYLSRWSHRLFRKDIDVESIDFNKAFRVLYRGDKSVAQREKMQLISPGLQARLIEINGRFGAFDVLVKKDIVIFMFKDSMLREMKTNFLLKGFRLDSEDKRILEHRMTLLLDIMSELSKCVR